MLKTVRYDGANLIILDQSRLPGEISFEICRTVEDVAEAIIRLKVRGAPLIGVTASYGLALGIIKYQGSVLDRDLYFQRIKNILASTRPTAVNLFWALQRMEDIYKQSGDLSTPELGRLLMSEAEQMFAEDIKINEAIGEYGQELLHKDSRVMTICNAGALATCGYGTALGVIRSAYQRGKIEQVWACETRPVLQGSRLTVWELLQDRIPVTLITDSMAGYTMKLGKVDAVITGADRIAANGDTANKIGTYTLAVLAHQHDIPFYVAAPLSTIDREIDNGDLIPIEERPAEEVRQIFGINATVPEVNVFNPAFDITPHDLIDAIITQQGIIKPPYLNRL
ncbi:MAG: S-methyl-5-thioribose-1-phosphate isomerase [Syntrophomonadaceae bacterium]|nr:S-methyl-5-thioribose-1-phosphate isomerase [Syntrophomonadaceae bacterium]